MLKMRYDVFGAEVLGNARLEGFYEFPYTPGVILKSIPTRVIPFDRIGSLVQGDWVHFYVHDKRFHRFLSRREHYWDRLELAAGFVGIDNSLYRDLPLAEQIHSCYLNRAIDYYLHTRGRPVIANVSWGDSRSYAFCFDGISKRTTVAVSTYGCCRSRLEKRYFEDGFVVMLGRLQPHSVVLHGSDWRELSDLCGYHRVRLLKIPTRRESLASQKEVPNG